MTEVNGNELLAFLEEAVLSGNDRWDALFALNDLVAEEEDFRAALAE